MAYTETEVKFHVANLRRLAEALEARGADLVSARQREINLNFDTPSHQFGSEGRVLRLRQDAESRLTYKSGVTRQDGIASREEVEFTVSDFDAAQRFLENLGYVQVARYDKYRRVYQLDNLLFMLDELPFGDFLEIEGESSEAIKAAALSLGLRWDAVVQAGYRDLAVMVCPHKPTITMTFDDCADSHLSLDAVGIFPADDEVVEDSERPVNNSF